MSTRKQQEASRRNGAQSHRPIPDGLTARTLVLSNESQAAFDDLKRSYLSSFNPANEAEYDLILQMVAARWRLRRYWGSETALLDKEMAKQAADPDGIKPLDEVMRCALAFESLANEGRALSLLSRYEARIARNYHNALQSLLELKRQPAPAPCPRDMVQNEPTGLEPQPIQSSTDQSPCPAVPDNLRQALLERLQNHPAAWEAFHAALLQADQPPSG